MLTSFAFSIVWGLLGFKAWFWCCKQKRSFLYIVGYQKYAIGQKEATSIDCYMTTVPSPYVLQPPCTVLQSTVICPVQFLCGSWEVRLDGQALLQVLAHALGLLFARFMLHHYVLLKSCIVSFHKLNFGMLSLSLDMFAN